MIHIKRYANCHKDRKYWAKGFCKNCYKTQWTKASPKRIKTRRLYQYKSYHNKQHVRDVVRNWQFKKKYGISLNDYNVMLSDQNGICKICGKPPKNRYLSVEHDHTNGKIRGLVCQRCNFAISIVEDNTFLNKVNEYLGV